MSYQFYDILGVTKNSTPEEIKKAYKKKAIQTHPDKGGNENEFKKVSEAYEVLGNEEKRQLYDQVGDNGWNSVNQGGGGPSPFHNINPEELLKSFFGNRGFGGFGGFGNGSPFGETNNNRRLDDVIYNIEISLKDVYFGIKKTMKISIDKPCHSCPKECNECKGSGMYTKISQQGFLQIRNTIQCPYCNAIGYKYDSSCDHCKGIGKTRQEQKVDMNIPIGVESGHVFKIISLGKQPIRKNDIAGDLIIQVIVNDKNSFFKRRGNQLVYEKEISLRSALIGESISIPHFIGEIPKDISDFGIIEHGKEYSIQGLGIKNDDLILKFSIQYPQKKLNQEEKNQLKQILNDIGL